MRKILLLSVLALSVSAQAQTASVVAHSASNLVNSPASFTAQYVFKRTFAANDPIYPNKVDFLTRNVTVAKSGNPMRWVKNNALSLAVTAAVVGAGYVIDELTNQVGTVNTYTPATGFFEVYGQVFGSADAAADYWMEANFNVGHTKTKQLSYISLPNHYYDIYNANGTFRNTINMALNACSHDGGVSCAALDANAGPAFQAVAEPELWTLLEPVFQANPSLIQDWAVDANGNPLIYPEVAAEQQAIIVDGSVTGAPAYDPSIVISDPMGDAPEVATDTPPLELPTDYARENTTQSISDSVSDIRDLLDWTPDEGTPLPLEPSDDADITTLFDDLESDLATTEALPTLNSVPSAPSYTATCQTIAINFMGSSVIFPTPSQCLKLGTGKDIIGWLLYMLTAYMIVSMVTSVRLAK